MTAAYASIANAGKYIRPAFYSQVIDSNGRVLLDNTVPKTKTVLKTSTADLLTQAMISVVTEGTGTACKLDNGMPVAGKTGTTSSEYDLWFCGYTPYLTASIWTGYDENKTLSGDQAYHERMWAKIMNQIDTVKKYKAKDFQSGKDVKAYNICNSSGKVAIDGVCPKTHKEYFSKGTQPDKCTYHSGTAKNYNRLNSGDSDRTESTTTKAVTSQENETTTARPDTTDNKASAETGATPKTNTSSKIKTTEPASKAAR